MPNSLNTPPVERLVAALSGLAMLIALTACDPGSTPESVSSSESMPAASDAAAPSDDTQQSSETPTKNFVVLPGTGRYTIGIEAPLGGYQLHGEPDEQPAGCTWSIEDADGVAACENQGQYVFLTDNKEAVTFVTDGCPDCEQFQ